MASKECWLSEVPLSSSIYYHQQLPSKLRMYFSEPMRFQEKEKDVMKQGESHYSRTIALTVELRTNYPIAHCYRSFSLLAHGFFTALLPSTDTHFLLQGGLYPGHRWVKSFLSVRLLTPLHFLLMRGQF